MADIFDWITSNQWAFWLVLASLLMIFEMVTLDLIMGMLSLGALAALLTSFVTDSMVIQVIVGMIAALALLFLIRPGVLRKLHSGEEIKSGSRGLVGRRAVVLEPCRDGIVGRVKIGGDEWSALPYDLSESFVEGDAVLVKEIDGATARITPFVDSSANSQETSNS